MKTLLISLVISSAFSINNVKANPSSKDKNLLVYPRQINQKIQLGRMISSITNPLETSYVNFVVETKSLFQLQKFKNCIQYTVCAEFDETLDGRFPKNRLQMRGKLSQSDLDKLFQECPQSELPENISLEDESTNPPTILTPEWNESPELVSTYKNQRKNIILKQLTSADFKKFESSVNKKIKALDYDGAIAEVLKTFELETFGYSVKVDQGINGLNSTINHADKEIKIGQNFALTAKNLILGMRHELEHAAQANHVEKCGLEGKKSDFNESRTRERSAYLNDNLNASKSCDRDPTCEGDIGNTFVFNFERYRYSPKRAP